MDQWVYWVGSRVAACMCCVSVGFSRTDRNELWQLPCVSPSGATSVPVYAPCVTMWWRDCSCGVRAAATVDIWSTWWTGSKAALTALPAAVTCASTPELLTTIVNTAGPLWECGKTHTHKQPEKMSLSFYVDLECFLTRKKEDGFEVSLDQKESEVYMCLLDGYARTNTITCSQMTFDSVCMSSSLYTWMLLFTVFNPKYCTGRIVCSSSSLYIMFILKYCRYWCINLYWRGNLSVLAVC